MAVSWLVGKRAADVNSLIAHRHHDKAVALLRSQLAGDRDNVYLRRTLADMLVQTGEIGEASAILHRLSDDFAKAGFTAKAVALLKRIDRFSPGRPDVYQKLASILPTQESDGAQMRSRQFLQQHAPGASQKPSIPLPLPTAAHPDSFEIELEIEGFDEELRADADAAGVSLTPNALTSSLFAGLPVEDLVPLMKGFRLATYLPGDIIVAEGERGATLFIVTSGRVKAFVRNGDHGYTKVRELLDGDFFGEISLLTDQPRTATITAASTCELLALDKSIAEAICAAHPPVRARLEKFAGLRLHSSEEAAARASTGDGGGERLHA